ncbi:hypothetical protein DFJ58DRAFT_110158 [Suillus subalutaceus]|uniref:uncharacterized protein n=1 Tax=Suillus subalutaceus TaxID=48586 RepID=UPI001B87F73B|nr:uncharacterized protein DFJ58DRAFT_110158 [Suillus subalutaceus]KAG1839227.1 hypothetical protein DFJ58DRAFT_110158 [Suillus subalutaceus]
MTRSLLQLFCLRKRTAQETQKYRGALPYELVEKIIVDAWCSIGDAPARWRFFRTIAILSKIWRDVLHEVVLRYVFIETMLDFVAYERLLSRYDPCARYVSVVLNAVDHTRFRVDEIAKHVPEAQFICIAITMDRRYYFDAILQNLLAKTESLTHLRICWPPLRDSFACPLSSVVISSVTHLHIARHPSASLGSILASFPNVTHLRLGTPCFLKNLVPYMSTVRVLILDAPPQYSVHTVSQAPALMFQSSVPLWNICDALEHGLLKSTANYPGRIIMNAGKSDADKSITTDIALSCQRHGVVFECRRRHPPLWQPSHLDSRRWDHDAWS